MFSSKMYGHRLKKKCRLCLQAFSTAEIIKSHVNHCFKINGKKIIKIPKGFKYIRFKNFERKYKLSIMIYADFESVFLPEDNGK